MRSLRRSSLVAALLCLGGVAVAAPPFGIETRTANTTAILATIDAPAGGGWATERVFPGLTLRAGTYLTHANDGTNRIFVCERRGVVTALSPVANPLTQTPVAKVFLDIAARVRSTSGNEEGLLSIAFHPRFRLNGQVFVCYTTGSKYLPTTTNTVRTRVSRFHLKPGSTANAVLDPVLEEVLFEVPKRYFNHNGGQLAFGPDGFLYVGIGDGGGGGDPEKSGQNLGTLKGKILRLDVDKGVPYGIPTDNPFVSTANAKKEIWAYGIRNPWRFSFDRQNGRLWLGDVGQDAFEEIDLVKRGGNYGWSVREGKHNYNAGSTAGTIDPLIEYGHQDGVCVIGGYVYRGARLPVLQGTYLYADYGSGNIWGARYDGTKVTENKKLVNGSTLSISSFGEDEKGEVYIVSYKEAGGGIYRLKQVGAAPSTFPQTLSGTKLFSDLAQHKLAPGVLPYDVVEPLWSDFALKARAMAIPRVEKLDRTPQNGWAFPDQTTLVKSFWLERTRGDPSTKRIVETRLLVKNAGEWRGYSYEWNDQGTDATLLQDSKRKAFTVTVGTQSVTQEHYFPSRGECFRCHTDAAGIVLGPHTLQMNRDFDYVPHGGQAVDNQLRTLDHLAVFKQPLGAVLPTSLPKLVAHTDATATIANRARAYLHVNCSMCHRPGGGAPVAIDLRYDTPLASTGLVNAPPQTGDLGAGAAAAIVKPKQPTLSVLYLRMVATSDKRMPPLASSIVDQDGAAVVRQWIESLP